jgi:hypothetical protein
MMPGIKVKGLKRRKTRYVLDHGASTYPQPWISASRAARNRATSRAHNIGNAALDRAAY